MAVNSAVLMANGIAKHKQEVQDAIAKNHEETRSCLQSLDDKQAAFVLNISEKINNHLALTNVRLKQLYDFAELTELRLRALEGSSPAEVGEANVIPAPDVHRAERTEEAVQDGLPASN